MRGAVSVESRDRPASTPGQVQPLAVERYPSIGALLEDACLQWGSQTALIEANRRKESARYSFRDFRATAHQFARRLQDLGVGPGDRVALVMTNQSRWLLSAAAIFYRGAVLVPLDYKLTAPEQAALIAHCKPRVVITEYSLYHRFDEPLDVEHLLVTDAPPEAEVLRWEDLPTEAPEPMQPRTREDLATIVYSSGTGGQPKGCMLTHGAYLAQLDALLSRFPMSTDDRYFSILPTNHAIDFMTGFVGPFACGATVVHQRTLRPELLLWTLQQYRITQMAVVPLILEAFDRALNERLDALPGWQRRALDAIIAVNQRLTERRPRPKLSATLLRPLHEAFGGELKRMFCGGAPTDPSMVERFYRIGIPVVVGYGLTEACTVVTVNGLAPFRSDSVGAPLPGIEVHIDQPDAEGIGEVWVRGPTLMQGYLDAPELTAETLVDGWLRTGDRGYLDGSFHLHLVGRSKNMIVTPGGKNVYPEDVEALLGEVPCEELVIFASTWLWPDNTLHSGELVAVLRAEDESFRAPLVQANRALADYKRISGFLRWSEPFPRTASMKVKRGELADALRAQWSPDQVEAL